MEGWERGLFDLTMWRELKMTLEMSTRLRLRLRLRLRIRMEIDRCT